MKNILKNTLSTKAHWTINKKLSRELGLETTLILQHFIDLKYNVFGGKEFYQQINRIEEELPLSEWNIKQSIKQLQELNLITVDKKGMPAKNHYNINDSKVGELLNNLDSPTSELKNSPQVGDPENNDSELNSSPQVSEKTNHKSVEIQPTSEVSASGKEKKQTKKEIKEDKQAKKKQAIANNVNSERYDKLDELVKEFCESYSINESYIRSLGEIDMKQLKSKNYNQWDNIRLIKEMMSERDNSINI